MSWELSEFTLEETRPVQVFNFEARVNVDDGAPLEFRGDGIYMSRTRQLRLNREAELAMAIRERFAPRCRPIRRRPSPSTLTQRRWCTS